MKAYDALRSVVSRVSPETVFDSSVTAAIINVLWSVSNNGYWAWGSPGECSSFIAAVPEVDAVLKRFTDPAGTAQVSVLALPLANPIQVDSELERTLRKIFRGCRAAVVRKNRATDGRIEDQWIALVGTLISAIAGGVAFHGWLPTPVVPYPKGKTVVDLLDPDDLFNRLSIAAVTPGPPSPFLFRAIEVRSPERAARIVNAEV